MMEMFFTILLETTLFSVSAFLTGKMIPALSLVLPFAEILTSISEREIMAGAALHLLSTTAVVDSVSVFSVTDFFSSSSSSLVVTTEISSAFLASRDSQESFSR